MDGTIITTVSGNVYPKDMNDWKLAFPSVVERLKMLRETQYKIVFFTNQGGIGSGKVKIPNFKKKIESIARKIDLPIQVFISGKDDIYRKPRPGMWNYLVQKVCKFYLFESGYVVHVNGFRSVFFSSKYLFFLEVYNFINFAGFSEKTVQKCFNSVSD